MSNGVRGDHPESYMYLDEDEGRYRIDGQDTPNVSFQVGTNSNGQPLNAYGLNAVKYVVENLMARYWEEEAKTRDVWAYRHKSREYSLALHLDSADITVNLEYDTDEGREPVELNEAQQMDMEFRLRGELDDDGNLVSRPIHELADIALEKNPERSLLYG